VKKSNEKSKQTIVALLELGGKLFEQAVHEVEENEVVIGHQSFFHLFKKF
jgi:hypothetical protein